MKVFLTFFLVLLALSQASGRCPEDCPDTEDVVWARDRFCNAYRNKCYFDKAKCQNPGLKITSKIECQKYCGTICGDVYKPSGGIYNGVIRNFGNECEKLAHTCLTGEKKLPDTEDVDWAINRSLISEN
nr:uncharacterized protein LOC108128609 [Drosophila bipectinata]